MCDERLPSQASSIVVSKFMMWSMHTAVRFALHTHLSEGLIMHPAKTPPCRRRTNPLISTNTTLRPRLQGTSTTCLGFSQQIPGMPLAQVQLTLHQQCSQQNHSMLMAVLKPLLIAAKDASIQKLLGSDWGELPVKASATSSAKVRQGSSSDTLVHGRA